MKLKKLQDQVLVLTGPTSGIGLVTARMAARRGARLVLAARSQESLTRLEQKLSGGDRTAVAVVADVGKPEDVQRISRVARQRFGGFDTWINNAGISIYGRLLDQPIEDMRRLFETNFWGVVYGSLEAARHFQVRGETGAIINVGSTFSDRAMPLQGMYSASKHAVKGFTDALRMELERQGLPVSVTLIKPSAIDTPYPQHAKNFLEEEPTNPPPIYAPDLVAKTILHCAEYPERECLWELPARSYPPWGNTRRVSRILSRNGSLPAGSRPAGRLGLVKTMRSTIHRAGSKSEAGTGACARNQLVHPGRPTSATVRRGTRRNRPRDHRSVPIIERVSRRTPSRAPSRHELNSVSHPMAGG